MKSGCQTFKSAYLLCDQPLKRLADRSYSHLSPRHLRVLKHHGSTKATTAEQLLDCDIVLSTYATLATELRVGSALPYQVTWFRLVLDEGKSAPIPFLHSLAACATRLIRSERWFTYTSAAHYIRHDHTRQFQAAASLSAKFRWCLTGTPIHNSLADLGSLISFLRRKKEFHKHVAKPIEENKGGDPVKNLRLILQSLCLRRTKELINLPEPKEIIYDVHLSLDEKSLYDMVKERAKYQIEDAISSARGPGAEKAVMQMVMCLRRICNHGTMDRSILDSVGDDETSESGGMTEARYCSDCKCEIMDAGRLTSEAKRLLCIDCYYEWESKAPKRGKQKRSPPSSTTPAEFNSHLNLSGHSTKVSLLVQDVDQHKDSDKWYVPRYSF